MARSNATTVAQYLAELPADRRDAVTTVYKAVRKAVPKGYEEGVGFGMICWSVPLSRMPGTYNGQPLMYAALANQKHYASLYLMSVYAHKGLLDELTAAFKAAGKKLDMGKSCIHFKVAGDLPLPAIAKIVARVSAEQWIEIFKASRSTGGGGARRT